ncbi:methyl-accepting chemotaxis protein [Lacimicrobium alkaliphilum]|uniref:Chemotaxis protein n=1 Tax=Lacimicrobium alkaliphilum TaxID=1526571 RepID=A0A0U2JIQ4_9ALTE|nr:PAS domain-containing methyl-accepting chemotaxis protein [Lacimicrobium alkaliphilum]ALS98054.1 chemotaxis protein [Lacimicrobium alkaliphilum]
MFNRGLVKHIDQLERELSEQRALVQSIQSNVAYIEFTPAGEVLMANSPFLAVMGYQEREVVGQHHRIFCKQDYAQRLEYKQFWQDLQDGNSKAGTFQRNNSSGEPVWLEATYFPIILNHKVVKVVKIATDVTSEFISLQSQLAVSKALDRSMAIIEFTPDGTIIKANDNFMQVMECKEADIVGKHHKIFCSEKFYQENPDFWRNLRDGNMQTGQFERMSLKGKSVWLEATYNPVLNENGRVEKVIKFAADISQRVEEAQAVRKAAEVAYSTAVETAQIAVQGADILTNAISTSSDIEGQVGELMSSIEELNQQSDQIGAIVSTISAIAEQTNLLALNAAIEAARAGDMGRGFAVVADEVRQLASRTSQSTQEITEVVKRNQLLTQNVTEQITSVSHRAKQGNELTKEVAQVIEEISAGAENVSQTVSGLSQNPDS